MNNKIFLLSAGLGNVSRGFEISAATWFTALKNRPAEQSELQFYLFSGGPTDGATQVPNIARNSFWAKLFRRLHFLQDGCRLEQLTFGIALLPKLIAKKPDIIWLQEGSLALILLKFKKIFKLKYKIMFCDGAPMGYQFAKQFDYIIFLEKFSYQNALEAGFPAKKTELIPHITLPPQKLVPKVNARAILKLDPNAFIVICVAAWNKQHKRIDYIISEFAKLNIPNALLMLCGQPEKETEELKSLAEKLKINVQWNTFTQSELSVAYDAADLFVLPSLYEGLGAVIIEAGMHNLPIIAHPHQGSKYILGEDYSGLTDLSKEGNLARKIESIQHQDLKKIGLETGEVIQKEFDKNILLNRFVNFINTALS